MKMASCLSDPRAANPEQLELIRALELRSSPGVESPPMLCARPRWLGFLPLLFGPSSISARASLRCLWKEPFQSEPRNVEATKLSFASPSDKNGRKVCT